MCLRARASITHTQFRPPTSLHFQGFFGLHNEWPLRLKETRGGASCVSSPLLLLIHTFLVFKGGKGGERMKSSVRAVTVRALPPLKSHLLSNFRGKREG